MKFKVGDRIIGTPTNLALAGTVVEIMDVPNWDYYYRIKITNAYNHNYIGQCICEPSYQVDRDYMLDKSFRLKEMIDEI